MKNFLSKAMLKKNMNNFFHDKEKFRFKSIPKLLNSVCHWVPLKEKLIDFDDVIQRLSHEILSISLKSIASVS